MDPQALKARISELLRSVKPLDASTDITAPHHAHVSAKLDEVAAEAERDLFPAAAASKDPDLKDEAARLYRQLAISNSWLNGREDRTLRWIDRAAELAASEILRDMVVAEQNNLRDSQAFPEIRALCQQGLVDKARRTLLAKRKATQDPVMRRRIDEFLAEPRNFLAPLGATPSMFTINGFGTMLYGDRDQRSDGSYIATLCLVFLFLPLLPFRAYLVRREGNGWRFYGRVPLSPFAFWWRRIAVMTPLLFALGIWGIDAWESSPYVRETGLLSTASSRLNGGDYPGALESLAKMSGTRDAGRGARLDVLASQSLSKALAAVQDGPGAALFLRSTGASAAKIRRPLSKDSAAAAEAALARVAAKPEAAAAVRNFITWMGSVSPDFASRLPEIAAGTCATCDEPFLLAATADLFTNAGKPCPPALLTRLFDHLSERRHPTWNTDTLSYLRAAHPAQALPLLLARSEAVWKGDATGNDLLPVQTLPVPLRTLIELDFEGNLEKRAEGLEKAADPGTLGDPQKSWHRLGAARRLAKVYGTLNERDPIRFPVSKARPWAIQAAELDPEDKATRIMALRYLLEDGDFARVIALGSGAAEDSRSATLVGIALARSGKMDEAGNVLRPLVLRDLPEFSKAIQQWEKAFGEKSSAVWKSLETGTAGRTIIARLNSLPKEKAQAEAQKWVRGQVEQDAWIAQLKKRWSEKVDIHPAASELAMIELSLGRAMPPGPDRQARLQAAESLFVELQKIQHDDPHQELMLGQVYFWLGKDKEGAEIFDRFEAEAGPDVLYQLGDLYRGLSRMDAARRVLEKAYGKADEKQKPNIASLRAFSTLDYQDRLTWLQKCRLSEPGIQVEINSCEARIALAAGQFKEAVAPLQKAVAYYAGLPESAMSLNNGAIVQQHLGTATGDPKYDLEALAMMRRAHELQPEDGIILSNYVSDLQRVGIRALAGSALRSDLLHEAPGRDWLDYVTPKLTPQEWAVRAKAQPELRRASELGVKSVIISPDGWTGYEAQMGYASLILDNAGLRRLREAVESKPPKREEDAADDKAHARGEYSDTSKQLTESNLARWEGQLPSLRKAGHAPTLGYALKSVASARLAALHLGVGKQTIEAALRDAEESVAVFDAPPAREMLAWIRAEQAAKGYAAGDEEFARWAKENPSLSEGVLLPLYIRVHPERAAAVRERGDVKLAAKGAADAEAAGGRKPSLFTWSWLDMSGHDAREKVRKTIQSDPTTLEWNRLRHALNRHSPSDAIDAWLAAMACGDSGLAGKIADQAKETGLVPLFFRK